MCKGTGKFSAVSVVNAWEKKGVGKALIQAVEKHTIDFSQSATAALKEKYASLFPADSSEITLTITNALTEMGVINHRKDLFPWYEKMGYKILGELPRDEDLNRIGTLA